MNMNNIMGLSWVVALALGMTACTKMTLPKLQVAASSSHATSTHASMPQAQSMHHMASTAATQSQMQSQSQPPHIMAYMDIMNKMHQAMSAGCKRRMPMSVLPKAWYRIMKAQLRWQKCSCNMAKMPRWKPLHKKIVDTQQSEIKYMQTGWPKTKTVNQPRAMPKK